MVLPITYTYMISRRARRRAVFTANLRTKIMDFRGIDSSRIFTFKGWNSQANRGLRKYLESSNLSRDNLSMEIGRTAMPRTEDPDLLGKSPLDLGVPPPNIENLLDSDPLKLPRHSLSQTL